MIPEFRTQRSATLVLGHTFSDQREIVRDLIAQPVEMRVMRWAETKVPITFDEDRRETDVTVECETCGEQVVAHVLDPRVYWQRRQAFLATGLTIIAIQVTIVTLFVWETLDGHLPVGWPFAFVAALVTLPVGFIVASFGAGQLTDVPKGRRPRDGVHSFRIDSR
jgi:uncharacterized membrane protein YhdT